MEITTVTGRNPKAVSRRQEAVERRAFLRPSAACRQHPGFLGFTLLELMIVISVIIILAAIVLPQYHKTIRHTQEAVLRDNLFKMRSLLDQFAADKGKLPGSLDELVSEGYM
ncbi:MAG: type IV pilin protein, partial [Pyrinomonadaceae bacterium]